MSRRIKKKKSTSADIPSVDESVDFDTKMYDHLKPKNIVKAKAKQAAITDTNSLTKVYVIGIVGILIVGMAITGVFTGDLGNSDSNNNNQGNPTFTDNGGEFVLFKDRWLDSHSDVSTHYHFFLSINLGGEATSIPQGLGLYGNRMKLMHVHDNTGKIHVELTRDFKGTPTLGDFFAIWSDWNGEKYDIGSSKLMGQTGNVTLTSGGEVVEIGNPGSYTILNKGFDEIISLTLSS